jgi:tetratricopeptide (TPR) repeat protein
MAVEQEQQEGVRQIIDGLPLLESAKKSKDQGNELVKKKKHEEAVRCYESGIAVLDKADGHPMLRQEVEDMIALKSVLYGNVAQCLLSQELYRRAIDAATTCLQLDEANAKALFRRSSAHEGLRAYGDALKDMIALQKLGGGALTPEALEKRLEVLQDKKAAADKAEAKRKAEEDDDSDDVDGVELVRLKNRFDEIVKKYDFSEGNAADEIAEWLTSGEWSVNVRRVATRWHMDTLDAHDFLAWIAKGLEFKQQNAENMRNAESQAPSQGDLGDALGV